MGTVTASGSEYSAVVLKNCGIQIVGDTEAVEGEMSYHWQDFVVEQAVPTDAVRVGELPDGSPIHIGRTMYMKELETVTYYAGSREAYLSFGGAVVRIYEFQLMMNYLPQFEPIWSKSGNGHLPRNAIESGFSIENEPMYVARAWKDGYPHPAKYTPALNKCHFVDGNQEGQMNDCDVLVSRIDGYDWIATNKDEIPADWFVACQDPQGQDIGVGYTYYKDERTLVKLIPKTGYASIGYDGFEIVLDSKQVIHVLVQHVTRKPLVWHQVVANADYANKDVLQVGYTHDGRVVHLGRYLRDGFYIPGRVIRHDKIVCVTFDGAEETHTGNFEVLYLPTLNEM